jgi:hypothetical protein
MSERVIFRGMQTTVDVCKGCRGFLYITDPAADGTFQTFHTDPMCDWYIRSCSEAKPLGQSTVVPARDMTKGKG